MRELFKYQDSDSEFRILKELIFNALKKLAKENSPTLDISKVSDIDCSHEYELRRTVSKSGIGPTHHWIFLKFFIHYFKEKIGIEELETENEKSQYVTYEDQTQLAMLYLGGIIIPFESTRTKKVTAITVKQGAFAIRTEVYRCLYGNSILFHHHREPDNSPVKQQWLRVNQPAFGEALQATRKSIINICFQKSLKKAGIPNGPIQIISAYVFSSDNEHSSLDFDTTHKLAINNTKTSLQGQTLESMLTACKKYLDHLESNAQGETNNNHNSLLKNKIVLIRSIQEILQDNSSIREKIITIKVKLASTTNKNGLTGRALLSRHRLFENWPSCLPSSPQSQAADLNTHLPMPKTDQAKTTFYKYNNWFNHYIFHTKGENLLQELDKIEEQFIKRDEFLTS